MTERMFFKAIGICAALFIMLCTYAVFGLMWYQSTGQLLPGFSVR